MNTGLEIKYSRTNGVMIYRDLLKFDIVNLPYYFR